MSDEVIEKFYDRLKEQEKKYDVKICVPAENIIDGKHLDCFWYGGEVGYIEYKDYKIVIGAYGDRRVYGFINGRELSYVNKNNSYAYKDKSASRIKDDAHLYALLDSDDPRNSLSFSNNNWFEVDLVDPNGEWIDLFGFDNVLENNLLDCFEDVSVYFEYVQLAIDGEI